MRLTVFGGAAAVPGSGTYAKAERIGQLAARDGWVILCGAYGGVMEAASRGAKSAGGEAIGYALPSGAATNPFLSTVHTMPSYGARLDALLSGDAFVFIVPDGIGTLAELLVVLNHNRKLWSQPKRVAVLHDTAARSEWWDSVAGLLRQLAVLPDGDLCRVCVSDCPEAVIAELKLP